MGTSTKKVYKGSFNVVRDGIPALVDEHNRTYGYDVESIKANPDHFRVAMFDIVEGDAPQEFLNGEKVYYHIEKLNLYISAINKGMYTHFRVGTDPEFRAGEDYITAGDDYADLSYRLVKGIHDLNNEQYNDIDQFMIGYVI